MRLADKPAPPRATGRSDRTVGAAGGEPNEDGMTAGNSAQDTPDGEALFAAAMADLQACVDEVAQMRDDITFEDSPAPKRLAPYATALAATAYRDGTEVGTGRMLLLYDPAGQQGWTGVFRIVAQVHADVDPEMAADPLLGEVGWSWLTEALATHAPGFTAPSGTVTRVITEGFGAKEEEPAATGFELRASWCPGDEDDLGGNVAAWCDLIAAAAGLPAQPPGTRALRPGGRRRR